MTATLVSTSLGESAIKMTMEEQSKAAIKALENAVFEVRCAHEHTSSEASNYNYLVVVRKDEGARRWVIDADSEHILEDDGGGYPVQELQVHTIRAL